MRVHLPLPPSPCPSPSATGTQVSEGVHRWVVTSLLGSARPSQLPSLLCIRPGMWALVSLLAT